MCWICGRGGRARRADFGPISRSTPKAPAQLPRGGIRPPSRLRGVGGLHALPAAPRSQPPCSPAEEGADGAGQRQGGGRRAGATWYSAVRRGAARCGAVRRGAVQSAWRGSKSGEAGESGAVQRSVAEQGGSGAASPAPAEVGGGRRGRAEAGWGAESSQRPVRGQRSVRGRSAVAVGPGVHGPLVGGAGLARPALAVPPRPGTWGRSGARTSWWHVRPVPARSAADLPGPCPRATARRVRYICTCMTCGRVGFVLLKFPLVT